MNINKILKFYLVLTLSISAIAALSYSSFVKENMSTFSSSVLGSFEGMSDTSKYTSEKLFANVLPISKEDSHSIDVATSPLTVNFNLSRDANKTSAVPGESNAEIMQIKIKSTDANLVLKSINFKLEGVNPDMIERVYLIDENKNIHKAELDDGYARFSNISIAAEAEKAILLSLRVDVSKDLHTGERFRFDIEEPNDIQLFANDEVYEIRQQYPIRGTYLSIAKNRPWTMKSKNDKKK